MYVFFFFINEDYFIFLEIFVGYVFFEVVDCR